MVINFKEVGYRIAKRRKELNLKQYEVCELIDANYKYLSNLETGRSAPSLEMIMKLCEVLKTTPDYFLLGTDTSTITDNQLMYKIGRLSSKNKQLLNGIVDLLDE
jgi:transcriptional regulator with XRE-family HTH domain